MLCQREEREAGRAYPRTCPTCKLGPCQKFGAKPLQSLAGAQAEIARLTAALEAEKGRVETFAEYEGDALNELDEWKARAEKAEAERDELLAMLLGVGKERDSACAARDEALEAHRIELERRITAEAERDTARAEVAMAFEAAAREIDCGCQDGVCWWAHACPKSDDEAIRALAPAHATAALESRDKATREQALRDAAQACADVRRLETASIAEAGAALLCQDAILAMIETEGK